VKQGYILNAPSGVELTFDSGAGVSTTGLYHYPATITNFTIASEFAQFAAAPSSGYPNVTTAGVINNIGGRQQVMCYYQEFYTALHVLDGLFHKFCRRLELYIYSSSARMDKLGNSRFM
jgi:hypothetical protein